MATGPRMLFANRAVEDLDRSVAFFAALDFEFDPRFTDETATAMVVNEQAVVMHDPDGHLFELVRMDPAALEQSPAEAGAAA